MDEHHCAHTRFKWEIHELQRTCMYFPNSINLLQFYISDPANFFDAMMKTLGMFILFVGLAVTT